MRELVRRLWRNDRGGAVNASGLGPHGNPVHHRSRSADCRDIRFQFQWRRTTPHPISSLATQKNKKSKSPPEAVRAEAVNECERDRHEAALHEREAELAHVMRLHTMGEITAEMAHELNQPLAAISNFTQAGLLHLDSGDPGRCAEVRVCLEQIHSQVVRAAQIIKNLRTFVGKPDETCGKVSLHRLTREAVELVAFEARRRKATIDLLMPPGDVTIVANAVQIQQVLVNLLINACEAMAVLPVESRLVQVKVTTDKGNVELAVADRGPGIEPDKLPRLFEPFFTTKPHGMGMGLPVSRTIIINHGGRIWAEGNQHGGTTFRVTLPLA